MRAGVWSGKSNIGKVITRSILFIHTYVHSRTRWNMEYFKITLKLSDLARSHLQWPRHTISCEIYECNQHRHTLSSTGGSRVSVSLSLSLFLRNCNGSSLFSIFLMTNLRIVLARDCAKNENVNCMIKVQKSFLSLGRAAQSLPDPPLIQTRGHTRRKSPRSRTYKFAVRFEKREVFRLPYIDQNANVTANNTSPRVSRVTHGGAHVAAHICRRQQHLHLSRIAARFTELPAVFHVTRNVIYGAAHRDVLLPRRARYASFMTPNVTH